VFNYIGGKILSKIPSSSNLGNKWVCFIALRL
jgi:hypothetical protein